MAARPDLLLNSTEALYGAVIRLAQHQRRVRWAVERLCAELGVAAPPALLEAASWHDIGKLAILPITESERPLDAAGRALLVLHPLIGEQLVSAAGWPGAARIIRHHHERWDGSGYPDGLAGEAIPEAARLLAAADCLAATSEPRPYRRAEPDVGAELRAAAGTQLDPSLVPALLRVARDLSEVRSP
jgi:HD-GYP domain-containing protein (c-di-GMP phosphodiesterase class II)